MYHQPAMQQQYIAIIGAGTAGLAAATYLARQGHDVTLIERAPALKAVGAGLLLQPSGLSVLAEMGCLAALQSWGQRIDGLYGATRSGRVIMDIRYADLGDEGDAMGLGVHRAALCQVLDDALANQPHRRWFGCEVLGVTQHQDSVTVTVRSGTGDAVRVFDAVIAANGSASQLRPKSLVRHDRQYPWGAMWLIQPVSDAFAYLNRPLLQQRYEGTRVMAGIVPTGYSPAAPQTPMLSMLWSLPVSEMASWCTGNIDLDGWKERVTSVWPELEPLLRQITEASQLLPATYRDIIMKRWGSGRLGIIGDAGHAMSPQLGQGANMALLDARALSQAIAASSTWESVWHRFEQRRRRSIRFYQRMSRLLTPLFQSRIPGAGLARDWGFPIAHRIPWLRRQMAKTIAGRKEYWLR